MIRAGLQRLANVFSNQGKYLHEKITLLLVLHNIF